MSHCFAPKLDFDERKMDNFHFQIIQFAEFWNNLYLIEWPFFFWSSVHLFLFYSVDIYMFYSQFCGCVCLMSLQLSVSMHWTTHPDSIRQPTIAKPIFFLISLSYVGYFSLYLDWMLWPCNNIKINGNKYLLCGNKLLTISAPPAFLLLKQYQCLSKWIWTSSVKCIAFHFFL